MPCKKYYHYYWIVGYHIEQFLPPYSVDTMRIFLAWLLTSTSIVLGQPLIASQPQQDSRFQYTARSNDDTLEIRSGGPSTTSPSTSSHLAPQRDSTTTTPPSTTEVSRKKLSRKEILKIPLEELLDLPMETVLEYAKVIDSMRIAESSHLRERTSGKSKRSGSSLNQSSTHLVDKMNADREQKQSHKKNTLPANSSRDELLQMKLKDMLDMRLGDILKLLSPILASSATSSAQTTPR